MQPVVDVINGDSYTKVGNLLMLAPLPSKTLKRTRSELEEVAAKGDFERYETPEDELPPVKKFRRDRRLVCERRRTEVEESLVEPLREAMKKNVGLFAVQRRPTAARMRFLGKDGLDDAPTPPDTPPSRRRRN